MKIITNILLLIAGFFLCHRGFTQDIHFSQFFAAPFTLSPSETGFYDGNWRIANLYRRQWDAIGVPYITISFGGDLPFNIRNETFGAGANIVHDQSGDAKLTVTKITGGASYMKRSGIHRFCIGLQAGYVMKTYSLEGLTFPNQYDYNEGIFDSQLPSNETGLGNKLTYLDLNIGFGWKARLNRFEPYFTLAGFHLNRPRESFDLSENRLPLRSVIAAGGKFDAAGRIYLSPNILYMRHSGASDLLFGMNLGYKLGNDIVQSVYIGPYYRGDVVTQTDAAVVVFGAGIKYLDVGFSYDINLSGLTRVTSHRGAFEISVIYTSASTKVYKTSIPCERF
ncbi:MAG: PorP/SprF family type IX secretion system membrane protein [Bacteroidetes bacterium]|nr:PorP/SprF family type IX secretion system membrane protein [Bacteroidota bacterium]